MLAIGFHGVLRLSWQRTGQKVKVRTENVYADRHKQKKGLCENALLGYRRASYG